MVTYTVIVESVVLQLSRGRQGVAVREGKTVAITEAILFVKGKPAERGK